MPKEVQLWKIEPGDQLKEITPGRLNLEERIETWLEQNIAILDPGLLVIGRQVPTDHTGEIDLLCIESTGDLVVVELKRGATPREVTAQVLDYGAWVEDLLPERIIAIAEEHLGKGKFEAAFREQFDTDLPDALNESHRLLIVGSSIDPASERIIRYLSDTHGVNINAATFQYFQEPDGRELLARVFLLKPAQVDLQSRTKGNSKRRARLTLEQLEEIADSNGVGRLYRDAFRAFDIHLRTLAGSTSLSFYGGFDGRWKAVLNLLPSDSSTKDGLCFQLYTVRLARLLDRPIAEIERNLPSGCAAWEYQSGGPEWSGVRGFIKDSDELARIIGLVKSLRAGRKE